MKRVKAEVEQDDLVEVSDDSSSQEEVAREKKRSRSDSGSPVPAPKVNKGKGKGKRESAASAAADVETNAEGDEYVKLSEYRRVTVRPFKGKILVDIREVYKDKGSGEMKPGAKGISLTHEQWTALKGLVGSIDQMIEKRT